MRIQFQIDVFARPKQDRYALIGEVKNRNEDAPFTIDEAKSFVQKAESLIKIEGVKNQYCLLCQLVDFGIML